MKNAVRVCGLTIALFHGEIRASGSTARRSLLLILSFVNTIPDAGGGVVRNPIPFETRRLTGHSRESGNQIRRRISSPRRDLRSGFMSPLASALRLVLPETLAAHAIPIARQSFRSRKAVSKDDGH